MEFDDIVPLIVREHSHSSHPQFSSGQPIAPEELRTVNCQHCHKLLKCPKPAEWITCPGCRKITRLGRAPDMPSTFCSTCRTVLHYPPNARTIRCVVCKTTLMLVTYVVNNAAPPRHAGGLQVHINTQNVPASSLPCAEVIRRPGPKSDASPSCNAPLPSSAPEVASFAPPTEKPHPENSEIPPQDVPSRAPQAVGSLVDIGTSSQDSYSDVPVALPVPLAHVRSAEAGAPAAVADPQLL
eukprot:Rmarinus@m.29525